MVFARTLKFGKLLVWMLGFFTTGACWGQVSYDNIRNELFEQTNAWRQDQSVGILVRDRRIDEIIQRHVEDKAACGYAYPGGVLDDDAPHVSCDGRTFADRVSGVSLGRASENMAVGYRRARDRVVSGSELGSVSVGSISACSREQFIGLSSGAFVCRVGSEVVEPGFIDAWARSTAGHRESMMDTRVGFMGVGYDEGIMDDGASCTDSRRDANNHIINRAGCSIAPIAGQMFGSMSVASGFYSTASQMASQYRLATTMPPGMPPPTTPPVIPPPTMPPTVPLPTVTERGLASTNMERVDRAVLDLFRRYAANPEALAALEPYFSSLAGDVVSTFTASLLSENPTAAVERIAQTMKETAPGQHDAPVTSAILLDLSTVGIVTRRLAAVRGSLQPGEKQKSRSAAHSPDRTILLASARQGGGLAEFLRVGAMLTDTALTKGGLLRNQVWVRGELNYGDQETENILPGFEQKQNSVLIGFDMPLSARFLLGTYAGFGRLDLDFDGGRGEGETDHYTLGLYGTWFGRLGRGVYFDTVLNLHYLDHDYQRRIRLGDQDSNARANYDAWMVGSQLKSGFLFGSDTFTIDPSVAFYYNYQHSDDYHEQGDSSLRMQVDGRNVQTWGFRGGLALSKKFAFGRNFLRPYVGFYHLFEQPLDDRNITSYFAIIPEPRSNPLVLQGRDDSKHFYQQELGLDWEIGNHLRLSSDYQLTTRLDRTDHALSLSLYYIF